MKKSILTVAAGVCAQVVLNALWYGIVAYLVTSNRISVERARDYAQTWSLLIGPAACAMFGGVVAGTLAPRRPVAHALVVGVVPFVQALGHLVDRWGTSVPWFAIAALALVLPAAWVGGVVGQRDRRGWAWASARHEPAGATQSDV